MRRWCLSRLSQLPWVRTHIRRIGAGRQVTLTQRNRAGGQVNLIQRNRAGDQADLIQRNRAGGRAAVRVRP